MKKNKKVSIITTFYNASEYIQFALDSISKQVTNDMIDIEYILVNDCSTDNSLEIVEKFKEDIKDKANFKVKLYTPKKNLGCGDARKYGITVFLKFTKKGVKNEILPNDKTSNAIPRHTLGGVTH